MSRKSRITVVHKTDGKIVYTGKEKKKVYLDEDREMIELYDHRGINYSQQGTAYVHNYNSGSSVRTYTPKNCKHHGDKLVWEFEGKKIYAAKKDDIITFGADLVIDLVGLNITAAQKFVMEYQSAEEFKSLNSFIKIPKILRLDWKDYSAPEGVPIQFWIELWRRLPEGKIVVACFGGHGRTGTCIACFLIANGYSAKDAIKYVRKEHCEHAIESKAQELYLELMELEYQTQPDDNDVRLALPEAT